VVSFHALLVKLTATAVTHAQIDFPQYYDPIQKYGPEECITSLQTAVGVIDALLDVSDPVPAILKGLFGLNELEDDDFADVIASPLGELSNTVSADSRILAGAELEPQGQHNGFRRLLLGPHCRQRG
jgi:hypothetical protein